MQRAFGIDADKGAGVDDLGRLIDARTIFKTSERLLELTEARIDVIRDFVGTFIFYLQRDVL